MRRALIAMAACLVTAGGVSLSATAAPRPPAAAEIAPAALPVLTVRHHHHRHHRHHRSGTPDGETQAAAGGDDAGDSEANRGEANRGDASRDDAIRAGRWQFAAQLQSTALPASTAGGGMKATYTNCIDIDKPVPAALGPGCTLDRIERDGARVTWSMTCTNRQNAVHSDGAAQYRGDRMEGTLISHLPRARAEGSSSPAKADAKTDPKADIVQRITGRYLGACPGVAANLPIIPPKPSEAVARPGTTAPAEAGSTSGADSAPQWVEPPPPIAASPAAAGARSDRAAAPDATADASSSRAVAAEPATEAPPREAQRRAGRHSYRHYAGRRHGRHHYWRGGYYGYGGGYSGGFGPSPYSASGY